MFSSSNDYLKSVDQVARLPVSWELFSGATVLIVGATGMIGTFLVDVLMAHNQLFNSDIHVLALGRSVERASERFKDYNMNANFTFIAADINRSFVLCEKADYIFHCASNTHPVQYATDPVGTIMTNIIGTGNILQYAVQARTRRIVFLSSVEVYGQNRGDTEFFDESYCGYIDCNTLRAGYPEGKRAGEALCQAYINQFDLDIVIPRICRVYGPTMLTSDSKALAQFIKKAVLKENIVLKSRGNQLFSYCYVADVAAALLYICSFGRKGEAYNVADGTSNITLKNLAELLAELAKTKVVYDVPDVLERQGYSAATVALLDEHKLKQLGWSPLGGLKKNLEETICILREMQHS